MNFISELEERIPQKLNEDNKIRLLLILNSLLAHNANEPFIDSNDVCDEK